MSESSDKLLLSAYAPSTRSFDKNGRNNFANVEFANKELTQDLNQIVQQINRISEKHNCQAVQSFLAGAQRERSNLCVDFPMQKCELDAIAKNVLMYGGNIDSDHPGFSDSEYRERRLMFGQIAMDYRHGQRLPRVEYNESERKTWATIFRKLNLLYPDFACREYLNIIQLLRMESLYSEHDIPQLCDVSKFLKARSGFQLRPIAGYLSPREFLAFLAFRVFPTTQYVRHPSDPFYSPEPDCCHELLGHVPMLADPDFAHFSQEIGLASIGAADDDIMKLAKLYFFTIEFGLCLETPPHSELVESRNLQSTPSNLKTGLFRAYGAGLLSCVSELEHAISGRSNIKQFKLEDALNTECMITTFQQAYFYSNSFCEAIEEVRRFADAIAKPFAVSYNPYTEALEIVDNMHGVCRLLSGLRFEAKNLSAALRCLEEDGTIRNKRKE